MKKHFLMLMAAGAIAFSACREDAGTTRETNENDSETPDRAAGSGNGTTSYKEYNFDAEYRDRANRMVSRVSQDLDLDESTQARLRTVYYNRARQMDELETRFTSTNRSGGMAADSGDMNMQNSIAMNGNMKVTGYPADYPNTYYNELETINSNVDMEVRGFLTPEQFKMYETNRKFYYDQDMKYKMESGKMKIDGEEAKLKTDDAKIKIEGEEYKYKTDDLKYKKEGDETKLKTDDLKIKKEGNETKIKTDDSKIKIEN